jgi:hypothetical protein
MVEPFLSKFYQWLKVEEQLHKEKQMLREAINTESMELNKRVDKINIDRMNDVADVQAKVFHRLPLFHSILMS